VTPSWGATSLKYLATSLPLPHAKIYYDLSGTLIAERYSERLISNQEYLSSKRKVLILNTTHYTEYKVIRLLKGCRFESYLRSQHFCRKVSHSRTLSQRDEYT
jgi:hypothetical protein